MSKARILFANATDWPFPARLASAFAGLGARVEAICPSTNPLRHAEAATRLYRFSPWRPLASLADAVTKAAPDLVIPCDDLMAGLLWRLGRSRTDMAWLMARSFGSLDAFPVLCARNDFLHEAAWAGAPSAETMALASGADLEHALEAFGLPLVLKADGFWGGDGVIIARDAIAAREGLARLARPSRLRTIIRALRRGEPQLLARAWMTVPPRPGAQRFVAGRPATSSIACWQGRVVAANHFDVLVSNGTGPATVVAACDDAIMADAATRIAARFGLSGFYGLDYMRDGEGRVFLLEINPRATPTSHLALGPGRDLAAAFLTAAGHPVPDRPAATTEGRIALFPQELGRDPNSPHLASAYHDLPPDDSRLAAALMPPGMALTRFSRGNSGISGPSKATEPLFR